MTRSRMPRAASGATTTRHRQRVVHLLLLLALATGAAGSFAAPAGATSAAVSTQHCFAETGQCVQGRFLDYWLANGGLAINGYPLTPERREYLDDGREYTVQYFERVRMELHPENPPPYDVLLGQFGRQVFRETFQSARYEYEQALAPVPPRADMTYFPETGHNVSPRFLAFWRANGGLAQFGYPLGEEVDEQFFFGAESRYYRVQYFERARFEYHPEQAGTPYEVQLGQFGRTINTWATSVAAPFARLYQTTTILREQIGPPSIYDTGTTVGPSIGTRTGAFLTFERGLMIYTGGRIQILCGTADSGSAIMGPRAVLGVPDTWTPDQPAGGGPGPRPGTYEPKYGFGKVWPGYRDCLGYATSPDETAYTQTTQQFGRGLLISSPDPRYVYALFIEQRTPGEFVSNPPEPEGANRYQRYTLP